MIKRLESLSVTRYTVTLGEHKKWVDQEIYFVNHYTSFFIVADLASIAHLA